MKKLLPMIAAMAVFALSLTGCSLPSGNPGNADGINENTAAVENPRADPDEADIASPDTPATAPQTTPLPTAAPEPGTVPFRFTRENFPRLDGSTTMAPLGEAMACVLLGEPRADVKDLISFNRTTEAYKNLVKKRDYSDGDADMIIAGEPDWGSVSWYSDSDDARDMLEIAPIALEALVFIVNMSNPVDNLTTEQVQKIYTGEIANWGQVGGDDIEIMAFQRNADSGSQVRMEKLVMQGLELAPAPLAFIEASMIGLVEGIRSFDGSASAIGYTVYYYANDMEMADGLKILSIDGVAPSDTTIASSEYPFVGSCYAAIRKDAAPGSPERILFDWLLGEEGRELIRLEGYVPVGGQQ